MKPHNTHNNTTNIDNSQFHDAEDESETQSDMTPIPAPTNTFEHMDKTNGVDVDNLVRCESVEEGLVGSQLVHDDCEMSCSDSCDSAPKKYKRCLVCHKECDRRIKRCKDCKGGRYCSRTCREAHKQEHQELCNHIQELEKIEMRKMLADVFSVREENQVPLKIRNELVKLVGEKPMLKCSLDGKECDGLWDTGSMVSMVNSGWLEVTIPDSKVMTVEEFLEGDNLHLCAANNTNVNVDGVVVLKFSVGACVIPVPFLVTKDDLRDPIIGYNVIKQVAKAGIQDLPQALRDTIPSLGANADAVISLLQSDSFGEEEVKVARDTTLPPQSRCRVDCRTRYDSAESRQNLMFTPYPYDME